MTQHQKYWYLLGIISLLGTMGGFSSANQPANAQGVPDNVLIDINDYCEYVYGRYTQSHWDCVNQYRQQQEMCLSFSAEERTIPELQNFCKPPSRPMAASLFAQAAEGEGPSAMIVIPVCRVGEKCPPQNPPPVPVSSKPVRTLVNDPDPYLQQTCTSLPESRYQKLVAAKPTLRQLCQSFRSAASTSGGQGRVGPKAPSVVVPVIPIVISPTVSCPAGFTDNGAYCLKPAPYGRGGGYPWQFRDGFSNAGMFSRCEAANGRGNCEQVGAIVYPKCKSGFYAIGSNICSPVCPTGMQDIGVSCKK